MATNSTKIVQNHNHIRYNKETFDAPTMITRSQQHLQWMNSRRTSRDFSDQAVPKAVIENIILSASTAPSGAHKQPWTFCAISNPDLKKSIRLAAEEEEYESYNNRMSAEWLKDLQAIGTNWRKPFLETVPWLIVVFRKIFEYDENGQKLQNYYVQESCGIATGFLLSAIHNAGLIALTHTPSPMNFLSQLLQRPDNEKPYLLIPVGYPADECWVPDLRRKNLEQVSVWYE